MHVPVAVALGDQNALENWSNANGIFQFIRVEDIKTNMLKVTSLSVLIDGDAKGAASAGDVSLTHNPDNVETTKTAILFQEDPGSQNTYPASNANGTTARIWRYAIATKELTVVARVNQKSLDPSASQGNWESSGIVDASVSFGPGWFYTNVQAHSVFVQQENRSGTTFKREAGQLLLIKIPGT